MRTDHIDEWARMVAAGMTLREVSERCGVPIGTVANLIYLRRGGVGALRPRKRTLLATGVIEQIRADKGALSRRQAAKKHGVSPSHVWAIWHGQRRAA